MRRRSTGVRLPFFGLLLALCIGLIVLSGGGGLDALRGIVEIPFNFLAGQFLNAERGLLRDRGWTFDPKTNFWNPPVKP